MASDMPIPQSMTAIKMRGLNIPDLEDGFLFIDEWVVDCLLPYRRLGFCTVDGSHLLPLERKLIALMSNQGSGRKKHCQANGSPFSHSSPALLDSIPRSMSSLGSALAALYVWHDCNK